MKINDFKENNENKKEVMEKKMEALKLEISIVCGISLLQLLRQLLVVRDTNKKIDLKWRN